MRNTLLLAAVSIIALYAGSATAAGPADENSAGSNHLLLARKNAKLLWNQNSSDAGSFVNSQNYSSTFTAYDDQGADDFVIPKGRAWRITEVDVTGNYYQGSGPASSENVIFYRNKGGKPGKPVRNGTFSDINGTIGPDFALVLPGNGLKLGAGHYWVSVVANEEIDPYGQWGWEVSGMQHEDQGQWQNPSGRYGICPIWGTLENCAGTGPDLMFDLRGSSQRD
jgi:hypothetical protein